MHVLLSDSVVKDAFSSLPSLFLSLFSLCNGRPLLSRSRRLSFPSSRSPSVGSSLCHRRTPASVPTLASLTVSMARRRVVGRRRWTSTATRCTSATILTRRYRLHGAVLRFSLPGMHVGVDCGLIHGRFSSVNTQLRCFLHTD